MKPYNPAKDRRYTITREWVGSSEPHFVVRFCDEYIGSSASRLDAVAMRDHHANDRQKILIGAA